MPITLSEFAARLLSAENDIREASEKAVEVGAKMVAKKAKQLIGHEQPEWPALKPETIEEKRRLGYPTPAPLLRDGTMRDSISSSRAEWEDAHTVSAYAGSTDPKSVFHELGTSKIPPRPFISLAARGQERLIVEKMGATFMSQMATGGSSCHLWKHVMHDLHKAYEIGKDMLETDEED
ncbi:HK97-gp10 family putative phage morphogenesis protein [Methylocystis sp. IM3]|uniref:HK97-gp10 family putative phage morphogenesis protein n=1 Tax=unclassified Methylocystis TaxID=2625913 RepID=UPI0030F7947C